MIPHIIQEAPNTPVAPYLREQLARVDGPMKVVAGPNSFVKDGVAKPRVPENTELLERTAHVRGKKESMNEFFARTGLGAAQILAMSKAEVTSFVETVSANEHPQSPENSYAPVKKNVPQRFVVTP